MCPDELHWETRGTQGQGDLKVMGTLGDLEDQGSL